MDINTLKQIAAAAACLDDICSGTLSPEAWHGEIVKAEKHYTLIANIAARIEVPDDISLLNRVADHLKYFACPTSPAKYWNDVREIGKVLAARAHEMVIRLAGDKAEYIYGEEASTRHTPCPGE